MKNGLIARGQDGRHEAQFDKGLHADRKQKIENLVGVEKRVEKRVALANQRTHVVAQNAVKANMLHAKLVMRLLQLRLPIGAQGERGVAAADRMFPEMWKAPWRVRSGRWKT